MTKEYLLPVVPEWYVLKNAAVCVQLFWSFLEYSVRFVSCQCCSHHLKEPVFSQKRPRDGKRFVQLIKSLQHLSGITHSSHAIMYPSSLLAVVANVV
jgi:hypothetical protein